MSDQRSRIHKIIAVHNGIDAAKIETNPKLSDLHADSLDVVEMVMAIEDELGVEIPDEVFSTDPKQTVGEFVESIEKCIGKAAA